MKIKKYIGKTMPEIMHQIRADLGPDAVILKTNEKMHGGFMGLFKKKKIEVVAALDPEPISVKRKETVLEPKEPLIEKNSRDEDNILQEIQQLKKLIQSQVETNVDLSPNYYIVYNYLLDQEIERDLSKQLIEDIKQEDEEIPTKEIINHLADYLTKRLDEKIDGLDIYNEKILHFVGPTGVGKTTTIAKIAADYMLKHNKKIAFITTDTYRIAAIDQLKTYAKILNIPIEVAYSKADYEAAIEKFSTYDHIFVDTAGKNFREDKFIDELKETINLYDDHKTYLVLSLTAKQKDIIDIFNRFFKLNIDHVIFTKIDETKQFGSILNIALQHDVKIGYLTNGQDVPNDIINPTGKMLSNLILGEFHHE